MTVIPVGSVLICNGVNDVDIPKESVRLIHEASVTLIPMELKVTLIPVGLK